MICALCPKGKREVMDDSTNVDPRGRNHIHVLQVNKKGKIVWGMCYLDKLVPFSRFEDFTADVSCLIKETKKK
ncbi:MAG: hypothetical protein HYW26_01440 [Candidatus Aenigmarchaeota archaeon]|nr:hypothetical protein [Candidatus Aenigmarchaeota archaeon]